MKKISGLCKKYLTMSLRDWILFFVTIFFTSAICLMLQDLSDTDVHVPMIFVLAVLIISYITDGYFYGVFAAFISVFAVNWAFTYPYFKMDFSLYGYPLTFMTMLAVGVATSTLTSRVKEQEKIRRESEKEKMRANLLRAISHDLRTPLTSISGSISAVLDDKGTLSPQECDQLLIEAKKDSEWLCRMVENLLSITRISGDEVSTIKKQDEILEEVLSEAVVNFKKKNPDVDVSVSIPDEMFFIPMDAMLVEQVIMNLMENAVSHGEYTSKIRITAVAGAEYATIIVSDNGKGIPEDSFEHLFDGMLQVNNSADKTRSMGIGLLVCRTIVEAHGGMISAENLPGGGASFMFTLKLGGNQNYYKG